MRTVPPHGKRINFGEQKVTKTYVISLKSIFLESSLQDEQEYSVDN